FAREKYWPKLGSVAGMANGKAAVAVLHPLVQRNTSDLEEQRYTSNFDGREFFFADHVMNGERVLPAVAHLEMARAAVTEASGERAEKGSRLHLRQVAWTRPVVAGGEPVSLHVSVHAAEAEELEYEIYSLGRDEERRVHSQGWATWEEEDAEQVDLSE